MCAIFDNYTKTVYSLVAITNDINMLMNNQSIDIYSKIVKMTSLLREAKQDVNEIRSLIDTGLIDSEYISIIEELYESLDRFNRFLDHEIKSEEIQREIIKFKLSNWGCGNV